MQFQIIKVRLANQKLFFFREERGECSSDDDEKKLWRSVDSLPRYRHFSGQNYVNINGRVTNGFVNFPLL